MRRICKVDGCGSAHRVRRGYCNKHYIQICKYGQIKKENIRTPNQIIINFDYAELVLKNIKCREVGRALIDIEDVDRVRRHKWRLCADGYVAADTRFRGGIKLARFIMKPDKELVIDHINHNPLDNRKKNLRIVTQAINVRNTRIRKTNKTGVVGVYLYRTLNKWRVRIQKNYITINIGVFNSFNEAVEARKLAELKYFGEIIIR